MSWSNVKLDLALCILSEKTGSISKRVPIEKAHPLPHCQCSRHPLGPQETPWTCLQWCPEHCSQCCPVRQRNPRSPPPSHSHFLPTSLQPTLVASFSTLFSQCYQCICILMSTAVWWCILAQLLSASASQAWLEGAACSENSGKSLRTSQW